MMKAPTAASERAATTKDKTAIPKEAKFIGSFLFEVDSRAPVLGESTDESILGEAVPEDSGFEVSMLEASVRDGVILGESVDEAVVPIHVTKGIIIKNQI